jgi:hypothetical protein
MKATVRRLLAFTAMGGLAVSLAACGQSDTQQQSAAAVAAPAEQPGWSMTDLAQVDPSDLNASAATLPQAVPMTTSTPASYQQAPSVDYSGADDVAYAPSATPDDYEYLGTAAGLTGMLGEAPPDYGFDYGGVRPWVWQTADHYYRYAEPVSGGYRYYYYRPNTTRPFLISDPHYSYGYRDGQLATIYDRNGRLIDARRAARERQAAQTYFARAAQMYQAAHREQRIGVAASLWQKHRDEVAREQRRLTDARRQHQAWQQWDARNDPQLRRDWASEAVVRRHAETSFDGWQKADFRTPAPRLYTRQDQQAELQKVAEIRRQQQAQRQQLAQRAADQRAVNRQQQAEADKLAQQRQKLADQHHNQQVAARQQNAQQARLQGQHQAQAAEAARLDRQKASAEQSRQAAEHSAQIAKNAAQRAEQAKQAAQHKSAVTKATAQKAQQQAQQAKAVEHKVDQKAEQAKAAAAKAQQAKAAAQRAAQQAAEAKAKAAAAKKGPAPQAVEHRSAKAQANAAAKDRATHKADAADKNGRSDKTKHDDDRG